MSNRALPLAVCTRKSCFGDHASRQESRNWRRAAGVPRVGTTATGSVGWTALWRTWVDSGPYWQDRKARLGVRVGEPHKAPFC
jgi:hypothetical protein